MYIHVTFIFLSLEKNLFYFYNILAIVHRGSVRTEISLCCDILVSTYHAKEALESQ